MRIVIVPIMDIPWPSRLIVVGASGSGKMFLVRQMILRGDLGVKKKGSEIIIASPVMSSLSQDIWKDLAYRGYNIWGVHLKMGFPVFPKRAENIKRLLIVDDIDHVQELKGGRGWLLDLFGTESHHSDISVVLISHHLRIGCPAILSSATAVILCSMPAPHLRETMKIMCLEDSEKEDVIRALSSHSGAPHDAGPEPTRLFNHVVVWRLPMFIVEQNSTKTAPVLYSLRRRLTDVCKKTLTPFE